MMIEYVPDGPEVELLDLREVTGKGPGARRLWTASLRDASAKIGSFVQLYHYLCHPDCSVKKNVCYDVTSVILESRVGLVGSKGGGAPTVVCGPGLVDSSASALLYSRPKSLRLVLWVYACWIETCCVRTRLV
jgi:hypothetical protein